MSYYERIQKSIDFIESNLKNNINLEIVAQQAYMSLSNFYRLFFALVGYSVKEYIRIRRISMASAEVKAKKDTVLNIAMQYGFESGDSFSRTFKRITGFLPSEFRKQNKIFSFERVNILEKYYDIQDEKLLKKYPDIKVLKELEPVKVAYYCYFGKNPEMNAFKVIKNWLIKNNLQQEKFRIFGYNNPSPTSPRQKEYGYEVCITIDENLIVKDEKVKTKILHGGFYATTSVKRSKDEDVGYEIMKAWERFKKWITESKYTYGGHQWLEEHLGFDNDLNHLGGVDLYMPIMLRKDLQNTKTFKNIDPLWTASYKVTGKNATESAREYFLKWAETEGLLTDEKDHHVFAYYNHERIGYDDFFYKIHLSVDKEFQTNDPNIVLEEFRGGYYAVMQAKYKHNGQAWAEFINWISKSQEYSIGNYWFFEEYKITKPYIDLETDMVLYMPVVKK